MTAITADTVLADVANLAEAKEIARDMRKTMLVVEAKHGFHSEMAKIFSDRYDAFVDAMAEKFAA